MPAYHNVNRPSVSEKIINFFTNEPGLSRNLLDQIIQSRINTPLFKELLASLATIEKYEGWDLIRYYRDNEPDFSIRKLLYYSSEVIQSLIIYDKEFIFHNWLKENKLKLVTPEIVGNVQGQCCIRELCTLAGIEYLNIKVFSSPTTEEWQNKLNEIVKANIEIVKKNIEIELKRVAREEVLAKKYSAYGRSSLLWKAAKTVAQHYLEVSDEDFQVPLKTYPVDIPDLVMTARSFLKS